MFIKSHLQSRYTPECNSNMIHSKSKLKTKFECKIAELKKNELRSRNVTSLFLLRKYRLCTIYLQGLLKIITFAKSRLFTNLQGLDKKHYFTDSKVAR